MADWIKWNGGECPIKSDKTRVDVMLRNRKEKQNTCQNFRWNWLYDVYDIIAYRITEDHEPKMTREEITAQMDALQKQLDALPVVVRKYWDGSTASGDQYPCDTHYFDIETINGVPHIHGVAMKEVVK